SLFRVKLVIACEKSELINIPTIKITCIENITSNKLKNCLSVILLFDEKDRAKIYVANNDAIKLIFVCIIEKS
ncbi:hypothetical protein, partial [Acinetobacter baumannii]|uniref:hypothetical protein n=1 Tax=Acinetobacter baumannii TaxID=470 RepID=UPI0028A10613